MLDYGWCPARTVGDILPGAMVVAVLLAATGYALWRWSAWGLLGAWFFLILAPTSSVMPLADLAFEHRMYLPLAAVLSGLVCGGYQAAQWLVHRGRLSPGAMRVLGGCMAGCAGIALGIVTIQRNASYQSDLLIWQDTVAKAPHNYRAHLNLGNALAERGHIDEAIADYRKALELKPDYAEAHYNLGKRLAQHGQSDEAMAHFHEALRLALARNDRAMADFIRARIRLGVPVVPAGQAP